MKKIIYSIGLAAILATNVNASWVTDISQWGVTDFDIRPWSDFKALNKILNRTFPNPSPSAIAFAGVMKYQYFYTKFEAYLCFIQNYPDQITNIKYMTDVVPSFVDSMHSTDADSLDMQIQTMANKFPLTTDDVYTFMQTVENKIHNYREPWIGTLYDKFKTDYKYLDKAPWGYAMYIPNPQPTNTTHSDSSNLLNYVWYLGRPNPTVIPGPDLYSVGNLYFSSAQDIWGTPTVPNDAEFAGGLILWRPIMRYDPDKDIVRYALVNCTGKMFYVLCNSGGYAPYNCDSITDITTFDYGVYNDPSGLMVIDPKFDGTPQMEGYDYYRIPYNSYQSLSGVYINSPSIATLNNPVRTDITDGSKTWVVNFVPLSFDGDPKDKTICIINNITSLVPIGMPMWDSLSTTDIDNAVSAYSADDTPDTPDITYPPDSTDTTDTTVTQ